MRDVSLLKLVGNSVVVRVCSPLANLAPWAGNKCLNASVSVEYAVPSPPQIRDQSMSGNYTCVKVSDTEVPSSTTNPPPSAPGTL